MTAVGTPMTRVDGLQKVTGAARYTAELAPPGALDMHIVNATIASGRVRSIDASAALEADGVVAVLDHRTIGRIAGEPHLLPSLLGQAAPGESFFPLQDERVHYAGQPVALVLAESLESAAYGASLIRIDYELLPSLTTLEQGRDHAFEPERLFGGLMPARNERGDVDAALAAAGTRVDLTVRMAANHHNPMEAPATIAYWEGDKLSMVDSTMGVRATQLTVAHLLGLPLAHIRVRAGFVGGSFGMKAMVWPHSTLTAMAARVVRRPVRLTLTRPQLFTCNGHREEQEQSISIGATSDGRLTAIRHEKVSMGSPFDDWAEPATGVSSQLYKLADYRGVHRLIRGNTMTPTFTRGPGESLGVSTLEMGMDELAYALGVDPDAIVFEAADSDLPNSTSAVGSAGSSMLSSSVHNAGLALRSQLIELATGDPGSPLHGVQAGAVSVTGGRLTADDRGETYGELLSRNHMADAEATGSWRPPAFDGPYGLLTFGAQFAEVAVDPDVGLVRVRRLVGAFAPGRVLNPLLARSQLMGGMLWGMSQALLEGNHMDPRTGRWAATNLAEYLVPVNADAPDVTVEFVEVDDELVGPLGAKGVGEIGQVGVGAAIANAIFHATGRRVRELPIAPELVMDP
jgi:CO/xanthine dehydrogenase Mo-binding subunit